MTVQKTPFKLISILLCGVAVLWLAAACGEERATATKPLPTPTLSDASGDGNGCGAGTVDLSVLASTETMTEEEIYEQDGKISRASFVQSQYESVFWRQPNIYEISESFLKDETGEWTDQWGITLWVTEKVDQGTLPPAYRIPEVLEGVPIRISDGEPLKAASKETCDEYRCTWNLSKEEGSVDTTPEITAKYIHEVRLKYDPLFWRQPNVWGVGEGYFRDADREWNEIVGIVVSVTKKVDQSVLPPEDRIPDCLEGVPVQVREEERLRIF